MVKLFVEGGGDNDALKTECRQAFRQADWSLPDLPGTWDTDWTVDQGARLSGRLKVLPRSHASVNRRCHPRIRCPW